MLLLVLSTNSSFILEPKVVLINPPATCPIAPPIPGIKEDTLCIVFPIPVLLPLGLIAALNKVAPTCGRTLLPPRNLPVLEVSRKSFILFKLFNIAISL